MATTFEINDTLWNNVSDTEKVQIIDLLKKHKVLDENDTVAGNANIPASTDELFGLSSWWCGMACDTAAAGAVVATTLLSGPALAVALAAIEAARKLCHEQC